MRARLFKAMAILTIVLVISVAVGLLVGSQPIRFSSLFSDPFSRTLFFRLRLPRVLMGLTIGASLALSGASLQGAVPESAGRALYAGNFRRRSSGCEPGHRVGMERAHRGDSVGFCRVLSGRDVRRDPGENDRTHGRCGSSGRVAAFGRGGEPDIGGRCAYHPICGRSQQRAAHPSMDDRQPGCCGNRPGRTDADRTGSGLGGVARFLAPTASAGDRRRHGGDAGS